MKVDFYQLGRDPAEKVIAGIARNTLKAGERLLVVSGEQPQLARIGAALWEESATSFLAHGRAGTPDDARQPVLLSDQPRPANGARYLALADGQWREGEGKAQFDRVFYLFGGDTVPAARQCWTALKGRDGLERRYWEQVDGKWVQRG